MKNIKDKVHHMGIKNKTLLRVSTVIVFFMFVFISVFVSIFSSRLTKESITYAENVLENMNSSLTSYFDEISAIANEANYDYYLQRYLLNARETEEGYGSITGNKTMEDYETSRKLFGENLTNRTDITSMMIFGQKKVLLYRSIYSFWSVIKDFSQEDWYIRAANSEYGAVVSGPEKHEFLMGSTQDTITVSRRISSHEDGSLLGVMLIDLNLNKIEEICSAYDLYNEGSYCLMNAEGAVVYHQNSNNVNELMLQEEETAAALYKGLIQSDKNVWYWRQQGTTYQVVSSQIEKTGWTALSITPMKVIQRTMYVNVGIFLLIGCSLLLLIIFILNIRLKKIVQPITGLADTMDMADAGKLDIKVPVEGDDETSRLARSFNKMLERIKVLMQEVVIEQEEKRKYELQMLQAQINPHFLYNTLDSIIWMAELKDENVVPMTEALARLFRISLNKGNEFISILDELEHVRNYLVIQSMRYEDKFDYEIAVSDEVKPYRTIKLIVQPIVENCIYHGIKKQKKKGHIYIKAELIEEIVVIQITDNGIGMSEKTCQDILEKDSCQENTSGSGIAVKNVNARIQLYFGQEYGLDFESNLGAGTKVTIKVPKMI